MEGDELGLREQEFDLFQTEPCLPVSPRRLLDVCLVVLVLGFCAWGQSTASSVSPFAGKKVVSADESSGLTADVQIRNAIAAASRGEDIVYACTANSTATFSATVVVDKPVSLTIQGCNVQGPKLGYIFDIEVSGAQLRGVSKLLTRLYSNSNTDAVYIGKTFIDWRISDLSLLDNLPPASRTSGAAIHADAPPQPGPDQEQFTIDHVYIRGFYNGIYLFGAINAEIRDTRVEISVGDSFYVSDATSIECVDCYAALAGQSLKSPTGSDSNYAAGFHFDRCNYCGIYGGESDQNYGPGVLTTGTPGVPTTGFVTVNLGVETSGKNSPCSDSLICDGYRLVDSYGWHIVGGDSIFATGNGVKCLGGGSGVISGTRIGHNTGYGVDLSGRSALGACAGVILENTVWNPRNEAGNINDPNGAVASNIAALVAARHYNQTGGVALGDAAGAIMFNNTSSGSHPFVVHYNQNPICTVSVGNTASLGGQTYSYSASPTQLAITTSGIVNAAFYYTCIGNPN
jgi:hypothetical protein